MHGAFEEMATLTDFSKSLTFICIHSPTNDRDDMAHLSRTKARLAWKVVLYCSNRASICSHALILLSQTRWIVVTGWRTSISLQPCVQTRLDCGSLLKTSISRHPVCQTCLDCGSLFAYTHQSPALCFKHVWIMVLRLCTSICLRSPLIKHVWIGAPCCVQASVSTRVSNTFCGSWSVYIISLQLFCLKHVLILVSYLCTLPPTQK